MSTHTLTNSSLCVYNHDCFSQMHYYYYYYYYFSLYWTLNVERLNPTGTMYNWWFQYSYYYYWANEHWADIPSTQSWSSVQNLFSVVVSQSLLCIYIRGYDSQRWTQNRKSVILLFRASFYLSIIFSHTLVWYITKRSDLYHSVLIKIEQCNEMSYKICVLSFLITRTQKKKLRIQF